MTGGQQLLQTLGRQLPTRCLLGSTGLCEAEEGYVTRRGTEERQEMTGEEQGREKEKRVERVFVREACVGFLNGRSFREVLFQRLILAMRSESSREVIA